MIQTMTKNHDLLLWKNLILVGHKGPNSSKRLTFLTKTLTHKRYYISEKIFVWVIAEPIFSAVFFLNIFRKLNSEEKIIIEYPWRKKSDNFLIEQF